MSPFKHQLPYAILGNLGPYEKCYCWSQLQSMYKWKYRFAKSKTNPTKARRGFDKITKMLSTKNRDPSIVHCSMLCDVLPINQRMVQSICEKKTI